VLLESGELNISEITRRSGLSHSSAARHLEFLAKAGLITEKRFNRIRIFKVDDASPYVAALNQLLSDWKNATEVPLQRSFS